VSEPRWLTRQMVEAFHTEQLQQHQGRAGIRDENLLESALARPRHRWHYGDADLAALAAGYAFGLSRNHPFFDGNKRVAFVALSVFLGLNGHRLRTRQEEVVSEMLALAAGERTEDELAEWIQPRMEPR
jgi:death on curing protein